MNAWPTGDERRESGNRVLIEDPVTHPTHGWGQWFAEQWALFVVLGIVAGAMFWVARHAFMVAIVVGCFAFVIGCVVGLTRLDRWLAARDVGSNEGNPHATATPT